MKTFVKIFGVIAIGAVIAAGLIACVSVPPTEEELALRDTLDNASWNVVKMANPPSLNGFETISKTMYSSSEWEKLTEFMYFKNAAGEDESDRGRNFMVKSGGIERTIKLIGLDRNTWYKLTAPERPGITYYYYMDLPAGKTIGTTNIYKNKQ